MRQPGKPIKFVGWIYGNKADEEFLRSNGVIGEMNWRSSNNSGSITIASHEKEGIFEYCEIASVEVAKKLYTVYPAFWAGSFTGLREDGEQTIDQPLWEMGHSDKDHKNAEGIIVSNFTLLG